MQYTFEYEISKDKEIQKGTDVVEGKSEKRAREYMEHALEERYPGEDGYQLLSLELIRRPGRPKERDGKYERITLEIASDLLAKIDASGKSRREYIEESVRQFVASSDK